MRCKAPRCRRLPAKSSESRLCARCKAKAWREKFPLKYAFKNLKNRAKQRGHFFDLTLAQYVEWAEKTGYAALKGKHKHSLSIHRLDPSKGYTLSNITHCTVSLNSRLGYTNMPRWMVEEMREAERAQAVPEDPNVPF